MLIRSLKFKSLISVLCLFAFALTFVFALAVSGYFNVILPAFKGDTKINGANKVTNDQFVQVRVISKGTSLLSSNNQVDFWVTDSNGNYLTNVVAVSPQNGTVNIGFNTNNYIKSGTYINLWAQNDAVDVVSVQASGWYDLR
ncbi:hypothetical protein [Anaerocellum diazotrophicum]|uniref:Uncharacterized protein n=1 Tax=Caldicellulosiruptor diazotrophicus TaxID=2806205 RepID=A0ABM7NNU0_9FIRM|nr:hypothetical protein [Caldicellulosiruptor diazotrophicus]BCS81821.1 hypothetical protein CaldiYA01_17810 [Caldicellulosiruptor diazotrophicus]